MDKCDVKYNDTNISLDYNSVQTEYIVSENYVCMTDRQTEIRVSVPRFA